VNESEVTTVSVCPQCGGTGWARVQRDGAAGVARCECLKRDRAGRLLQAAKIPARYTHCDLESFDLNPRLTNQSHERAKLAAEKFVREYPPSMPFGLLFMGPPGVGKTHLAVGIIKGLMKAGVPCLFRTFPELLKEIQNSYSPISQSSEFSLLSPVLETEVLVLDELGAQNPSSWVKDTVSYIINYRYGESKVTIFTTNYLDKDEPGSVTQKGATYTLAERIGDQMRSRLFEMCKTVVISGNDFRQKVKQAEHHF
jgi:DNA replication protein DnaC